MLPRRAARRIPIRPSITSETGILRPAKPRNRGDSVLTEEKHLIRVLFFRDHEKPGVNAADGRRAGGSSD